MPGITCNLMGGLGNQLFQIASTFALAKRFGISWFIENGQLSAIGQGHHPSKYYTNVYKKVPRLNSLLAPIYEHKEREWTFYDMGPIIEPFLSACTIQLDGYFQSDRHFYGFDKEVKDLFTPTEGIQEWLKTNSTVFQTYPELFEPDHTACYIGVRRGDYLKVYGDFHNVCQMDYYEKAMSRFPKDQRYYIASDDIAWCKEQFKEKNAIFLDLDDTVQLYVGALFKNYILSNSSFHWWSSFLSIHENPTIYVPDKWVFGPQAKWEQYHTIYRRDMTIIKR
jgi:Glycosyl transferase family 11